MYGSEKVKTLKVALSTLFIRGSPVHPAAAAAAAAAATVVAATRGH